MQEINQNQDIQLQNVNQEDQNNVPHTNFFTELRESLVLKDKYQNSNLNDENSTQDHFVDHKISLDELQKKYNTNFESGLSQQQADLLLKKYGENKIPSIKQRSAVISKFFKQMKNMFSLFLWICVVLFIVAQVLQPNSSNIYIAVILASVIFISAAINFQQHSIREALNNKLFSQLTLQKVEVIRDGQYKQVDSTQLVVGDIIQIKTGQRIPADIRILVSYEMMIDISMFTGETELKLLTSNCSHPENILETSNLALFGTFCRGGEGKGVVINTGCKTIFSITQFFVLKKDYIKTPLINQVDSFTIFILITSVLLSILLFLVAFFYFEFNISDSLLFGISILATNSPLGFLCCLSISLTIAASHLQDKKVLVKNPEIIETIASVSCICTEKIGVLTEKFISVHNLCYKGRVYQSKNMIHLKEGEIPQYDLEDLDFKILQKAAVLSTEARFDTTDLQDQQNIDYTNCPVIGKETEAAIIRFYQSIEDINLIRSRYQVAINPNGSFCKIPFSNQMKCSLTIVEEPNDDSYYTVYINGSPERVQSFCSEIILNGQSTEINNQLRQKLNAVTHAFNRDGQRVLGFARLQLSTTFFPQGSMIDVSSFQNLPFNMNNFQFCGLISLTNPPKQGVEQSILKFRQAGIKIIIISGDQPIIVEGAAKQLNIIPKDILTNIDLREINSDLSWFEASQQCEAMIASGGDIAQYIYQSIEESKDEYFYLRQWISKPYCIFSRMTPRQKQQIIEVCQQEGYIVASIGNIAADFYMMKQADVAISMNISGSDAVKDEADIILLDNNFSSVVSVIEESRKMHDNLKKAIFYLLSSSMAEITPFFSFFIFNIPLPLSGIYMIILSICNQFLPAISLIYEKAETDLMTRKPLKKIDHLISSKLIVISYFQTGLIASAAGHLSYFIAFNYFGFPVLSLFGLASITGYRSPQNDFGNYNNPLLNNSIDPFYNQDLYNITKFDNCNKPQYQEDISKLKYSINWFKLSEGKFDLRKSLVYCDPVSGAFLPMVDWSDCDINKQQNWSPLMSQTACYSVEAINYVQSVYFVTIILQQWFHVIACKTRSTSFVKSAYNILMLQGMVFQTLLAVFLLYVPGVQIVFGGRPIFFWLWTSCISFTILLLIYEEIRKFCCRKYKWFYKYCYW